MRIDLPSNAANVRQVTRPESPRPMTPSAGTQTQTATSEQSRTAPQPSASPPPSATRRTVAAAPLTGGPPLSTMADLAEEPRFALLIGLMERLTGREVQVVPPATMVLGQRKAAPVEQPHPSTPSPTSAERPTVNIRSVSPASNGDSYRVGATYRTPDGGGGSVEIDVGRTVIEQHTTSGQQVSAPLRLEIDHRALYAAPEQTLAVRHRSADAVSVSADRPHIDVDA